MRNSILIKLCSLSYFSFKSTNDELQAKATIPVVHDKDSEKYYHFLSYPICTDDYDSEMTKNILQNLSNTIYSFTKPKMICHEY